MSSVALRDCRLIDYCEFRVVINIESEILIDLKVGVIQYRVVAPWWDTKRRYWIAILAEASAWVNIRAVYIPQIRRVRQRTIHKLRRRKTVEWSSSREVKRHILKCLQCIAGFWICKTHYEASVDAISLSLAHSKPWIIWLLVSNSIKWILI